MNRSPSDETDSRKRLMALMTRHQRQIFAYIYTLVPRRHDAEDLLQETSLVICEKFSEFETGTDFGIDSDLFAAGLDSMSIMQLSLIIEEEFGTQMPDRLITRETFSTARRIAAAIREVGAPQAR